MSNAGITALVSAALAVAGCGGSSDDDQSASPSTAPQAPMVDSSMAERDIKQQFSSSGTAVTKVKCPSGEKFKSGATFKCDVSWSNGASGKVKVTEASVSHYTYSLVSGSVQIPGSSADKALEKDLAEQGAPDATVNCPKNIVVKKDTTVTCNVSSAGGRASGQVTFTFSSEAGTIDPSSVQTG
jgi:hypothetical protein